MKPLAMSWRTLKDILQEAQVSRWHLTEKNLRKHKFNMTKQQGKEVY